MSFVIASIYLFELKIYLNLRKNLKKTFVTLIFLLLADRRMLVKSAIKLNRVLRQSILFPNTFGNRIF